MATEKYIPFKQVDVFSATPFMGNPVAVILDADGVSDSQMQRIANWTNLSETTFVLKPTVEAADYRLRIFTPQYELPFAGHPTLGSARAVLEHRHKDTPLPQQIIQQCARGLIPIRIDAGQGGRLSLRMPSAKVESINTVASQQLVEALKSPIVQQASIIDVGPRWLVVRLSSIAAVVELQPDMIKIAQLSGVIDHTGITVFACEGTATEVRSFFPSTTGIVEDPVCGSGNGAVAVYRWREGQRDAYIADQGRCVGRAGKIFIHYDEDGTIWLGGDTTVGVSGTLSV